MMLIRTHLARSTSCLLDGKALAAVAPAYSDRRRIRNVIQRTRNHEFPYGEDYDGKYAFKSVIWEVEY
jgi:hypothetical protein